MTAITVVVARIEKQSRCNSSVPNVNFDPSIIFYSRFGLEEPASDLGINDKLHILSGEVGYTRKFEVILHLAVDLDIGTM